MLVSSQRTISVSKQVNIATAGLGAMIPLATFSKSQLDQGIQPYLTDCNAMITSLIISSDIKSFPSAPVPNPGLADSTEGLIMAADSQWGCHNLLCHFYRKDSLGEEWIWMATASLNKNALFGWHSLNILSLLSSEQVMEMQEGSSISCVFQVTLKDYFVTLPLPIYEQLSNGDWKSTWNISLPNPGNWSYRKIRKIDGGVTDIVPSESIVNNTNKTAKISISSFEGKVGGYKLVAHFRSTDEYLYPNALSDKISILLTYKLDWVANLPDAPPIPILVQGTVQQVMQYSETKVHTQIGTLVKKTLLAIKTNRLSGSLTNTGLGTLTLFFGDATTSNLTVAAGATYYFPSSQVNGLSATSSAAGGSCSTTEVWRE